MAAKKSIVRCLTTKNGNLLVFMPEKLIPDSLRGVVTGNQFIYLDGKSGKWCKHPQKEVVEKTALGQGEWSFLLGVNSQKPRPVTEREMKSLEVALLERELYFAKNKKHAQSRKVTTTTGQNVRKNDVRVKPNEFVKTQPETRLKSQTNQQKRNDLAREDRTSHITTLHVVDEETNETKEVTYRNVVASNSLADFFQKKDARKVA